MIKMQFLKECYFHKITGYWCPGCGGTRAVRALLKGDVIRSILYNPVPLFLVVYSVYVLVRLLSGRYKAGDRELFKLAAAGACMCLGLALVSCMIKNILIYQGFESFFGISLLD